MAKRKRVRKAEGGGRKKIDRREALYVAGLVAGGIGVAIVWIWLARM